MDLTSLPTDIVLEIASFVPKCEACGRFNNHVKDISVECAFSNHTLDFDETQLIEANNDRFFACDSRIHFKTCSRIIGSAVMWGTGGLLLEEAIFSISQQSYCSECLFWLISNFFRAVSIFLYERWEDYLLFIIQIGGGFEISVELDKLPNTMIEHLLWKTMKDYIDGVSFRFPDDLNIKTSCQCIVDDDDDDDDSSDYDGPYMEIVEL